MGKVIHLELCKKFKFDHSKKKWYIHNPESVQEYETKKLLWDFEIQTDHLISARWPNLIIINKKKKKELWTLLFQRTTEYNWKKAKRKKSTWTLLDNWKKLWDMKMTFMSVAIGVLGTVTKGNFQGLDDLEIKVGWRQSKLQHSAGILRRVQQTWGDLLSLKLQLKPWPNVDVNVSKSKITVSVNKKREPT